MTASEPAAGHRGCLGQVIGFVLAVVGVGIVVLAFVVPLLAARQSTAVPSSWSEGRLHLTTSSVDLQVCDIAPAGTAPRRVVVPRSDIGDNGVFAGVYVVPEPGVDTALRCDAEVRATSGSLLLLYPLAEYEPWVVLPAIVVGVIGIVYGRPFEAIRRPRR